VKKVFKYLILILAIVLFGLAIPQLIMTFPGFLFKKKFTYRNFLIRSDAAIDPGMNVTLDSISERLSATGFYDASESMEIIFCQGEAYTDFIDKISMGPHGAGFHHFSGNIYLFTNRIAQFRQENLKAQGEEKKITEYTYQEFELDKILMHEILHKLHSDTLGMLEFKRKMPPPHWKAEGFAEYYTFLKERKHDVHYDFRERVRLYLKYKERFPLFYFRSQLLYEFLAEHRNMTFVEIMRDDVDEEMAFAGLMEWYTAAD